jgi:hypothetical protein
LARTTTSGSTDAEYQHALTQVVSFLTVHDGFFANFRNGGGEVEIVLNHIAMIEEPKGIAFDLELSPVLLTHLSAMGVGLRVRAWSENPL